MRGFYGYQKNVHIFNALDGSGIVGLQFSIWYEGDSGIWFDEDNLRVRDRVRTILRYRFINNRDIVYTYEVGLCPMYDNILDYRYEL